MPDLIIPAQRRGVVPRSERADRPFKPVPKIPARNLNERAYKPSKTLVLSLGELEQSAKISERMTELCRTTHPTNRLRRRLFRSVVECCRKCRTAFAHWDLEENLNGLSAIRPRLGAAVVACWSAVTNAIPHLQQGEHQELANAYLHNIDERIELLTVAQTQTWADYERKLQHFLTAALRR
jgi:hypothetical protein